MNKSKRDKLAKVRDLLNQASNIVSEVLDDEQDCLDNMPENLQFSDRYERMEAAISNLEDGLNSIESAENYIADAAE
jgi:vacuolar-type H+-ATPase subunit E/Vma4